MSSAQTRLVGLFLLSMLALFGPDHAMAECSGNTQSEMNECAANDYKLANRDLNAYYSKLEKTDELVKAERAWIAYRDAECNYQAKPFAGGSAAPMVLASCLADLTKQRLQQLISDTAIIQTLK